MRHSEDWNRITRRIDALRDEMVAMQGELTARPAIGPTNGGIGEVEKSAYLRERLEELNLAVTEFRAPDPRVPSGYRPSLIGFLPGEANDRTVWIMTHIDVVPAGALNRWNSDPFAILVKDGKIYGRGVEDNQQEMVSSYFALKALLELGIKPKTNVGLVFVADEETGSKYGISYVLNELRTNPSAYPVRFQPEDLVLVPDAGDDKGSIIEIAEKSIAWLKFTTIGRQGHGSSPADSRNAHRAGARLLLQIDDLLHKEYTSQNPLFVPPYTTAEPTKKENNVPNINTIPGEDIFYFDCRVLPEYSVHELLKTVESECQKLAQAWNVEIRVTTEQLEQAAPPTSPDAPVVKALSTAVREVLGVETRTIGIGGGTVAAFFRRAGIPAAVWGRYQGAAHSANESCLIDNMVGDAKVYAHIFRQER